MPVQMMNEEEEDQDLKVKSPAVNTDLYSGLADVLIFLKFSEARRWGFSPGTPLFSPPSLVNGFSQQNKAKINASSTLSNLIVELSLRT